MKLRRPNLEAIYREVDHYIPKKEYPPIGKTDFPA